MIVSCTLFRLFKLLRSFFGSSFTSRLFFGDELVAKERYLLPGFEYVGVQTGKFCLDHLLHLLDLVTQLLLLPSQSLDLGDGKFKLFGRILR